MNNLFYTNRRSVGDNPKSDFKSDFKYCILEEGKIFKDKDIKYNYLMFIRKGEVIIHCNQFLNRKITSGQFILLPKASQITCKIGQTSEVLMMTFDMLHNVYDKQMLRSYQILKSNIPYDFLPLPIHPPLQSFVDLLVTYLERGLNSEHLNEIKEKELFILLRGYYTRDEIISLLHPLIGISDFKNFIFKSYMEVNNVAELVDLSGMGRTAFDAKFREEFGMSARQWMLKQIAEQVLYRSMEPDVAIKDIMREFKFNSPTHFNWFCRQQYGCTPGELIKKSAEKLQQMKI